MSTERPELVSSRFIQSEPLTASPPSSPPPAHTASHHRKSHRSSGGSRRSKSDSLSQHERSPSPTQTYIPGSGSGFLPKVLPTTSLLSSIPGAAHYSSTATSGQKIGNADEIQRRASISEAEPELSESRKRVLEDVIELFSSRPSLEILERRWRRDAIFEDPLSKCFGYKEYAPQWFAMPKAFPQSIHRSHRIISSTLHPHRLIYCQEQEYTIRFIRMKKLIKSIVVIDLDEDDKIVKLEDRWNGQEMPVRWGAYYLRRFNAKTLPWFVRVPKAK